MRFMKILPLPCKMLYAFCEHFILLLLSAFRNLCFMNGLFGLLDGALDSIDVFNFWDSVINILAETFVFVLVYLVNWMVKTL